MDDHDWLSAILKSIGEGVIAADKKDTSASSIQPLKL